MKHDTGVNLELVPDLPGYVLVVCREDGRGVDVAKAQQAEMRWVSGAKEGHVIYTCGQLVRT